jgi:hypothetical protein
MLFEITVDGKMKYLSTGLFRAFGPVYVTKGEQIYVTTAGGGSLPVGNNVRASVGAIMELSANAQPRLVASLKFAGGGGPDDVGGVGMDVRNAMRQRLHFRHDEHEILFLNEAGGKFSEGCMYSLTTDGAIKDLRDFHKTESLGGPINEILLAGDGAIYGVMGATQVIGNDPTRVTSTPLTGALFQILENGEMKILWGFGKEGPRAMLAWHDGAIYGLAQNSQGQPALYRLNLPAASKAP